MPPITQEQADAWRAQDIAEKEREVNQIIRVPLTQGQFDALVSFAYNCKGWQKSTLIRLLNAGDTRGASAQFPLWIHSGHGTSSKTLGGLIVRRGKERALFDEVA